MYGMELLQSKRQCIDVAEPIIDKAAVCNFFSKPEWNKLEELLQDTELLIEQLQGPGSECQSWRLLLLSCYHGNKRAVQEILPRLHCDFPSNLELNNQTPLHLATLFGHVEIVAILLQNYKIREKINVPDSGGNTALMCAAKAGYDIVVKKLLAQSADTGLTNSQGFTALEFALANGNVSVMRLLQKKQGAVTEARINANLNFYSRCCEKACKNGWVEILEYLKDSGICLKDVKGNLMHIACSYDQYIVVKLLQDNGVSPDKLDEYSQTPLFAACQNGKLSIVKHLRETGCNINHRDSEGRTPVFMAAANGHRRVVKYLEKEKCNMNPVTASGDCLLAAAIDSRCCNLYRDLESKLKPSSECLIYRAADRSATNILKYMLKKQPELLKKEDKQGNTVLLIACRRQCTDVIHLLQRLGANFSHANFKGNTPAMYLCSAGRLDLLKATCKTKGSLDRANWKGETPMLRAARYNYTEVVKYLMENTASPENACDHQGRTVAFYAVKNRNHEILHLLAEKKAPLDSKTRDNMTPMLLAAEMDDLESVKLLLESQCRVNCVTGDRRSLASFCALNGNKEMLNLAVKFKADLHTREKGGSTPVINACMNGKLDVLIELEKLECYLDARTYNGESGLHMAAHRGCTEVVRFLLENNCDCDARDKDGNTPFMSAAKAGNQRCMQLLYEREKGRCDIYVRNEEGRNALHVACLRGQAQCVEYLLLIKCDLQQTDKSGATPLMLACQSGSFETFNHVIKSLSVNDRSNQVEIQDKWMQTCVHYAAKGGCLEMLKFLEKMKLPMDVPNSHGETPLIISARGGFENSCLFLLDSCNVTVNHKVLSTGRTALHEAAICGNLNVIQQLEARGAEMDRPDTQGMTPLLYAAENGSREIVTFLLKFGCRDTNQDGENLMHLAAKAGCTSILKDETIPDQIRKELLMAVTNKNETCLTLFLEKWDRPNVAEFLIKHSDPNHRTKDGMTPYLTAVKYGRHRSIVMLKKYCDIKALDADENSALMLAAKNGDHECLRLLMGFREYDVKHKNRYERTALHLSCSCQKASCLCTDILLSEIDRLDISSMIDWQDTYGFTATMNAVRTGCFTLIQTLVHREPQPQFDLKSKSGLTLWTLAFQSHREEILDVLESAKPAFVNQQDLNVAKQICNRHIIADTFQAALKAKQFEFIKKYMHLFAGKESSFNGACRDGEYLLHACAEGNLQEEAEALIHSGADVNCRDLKKQTPLLVAVKNNMTSLVEWLLLKGCDMDAADEEGTTALISAVRCRNFHLVECLLQRGAALHVVDNSGRTAMHYAAEIGSVRILLRLFKACQPSDSWVSNADNNGATVGMLAAKSGNRRILAEISNTRFGLLLLKPSRIRSCFAPVVSACTAGWYSLTNIFYQIGLCHSEHLERCLAAACSSGNLKLIEYMLEIYICEKTPLPSSFVCQAAGRSGDTSTAVKLIQQLKSPSHAYAIELLVTATACGHQHVVKHLLSLGVPKDTPDARGNLPCLVAALFGHFPLMELLLPVDDILAVQPNQRGRSLRDLAIIGGKERQMEQFLSHAILQQLNNSTSRSSGDLEVSDTDPDSLAVYESLGKHIDGSSEESEVQEYENAHSDSALDADSCFLPAVFEEERTVVVSSAPSDAYKVTSPQGLCVIINVAKYDDGEKYPYRNGSEFDVDRIEKLFKDLNFDVKKCENPTRQELVKFLVSIAESEDLTGHGTFVCFLMAHGADDDRLIASDGEDIAIKTIAAHFNSKRCPGLKDKPKLFFIQMCRGSYEDIDRSQPVDGGPTGNASSENKCPLDSDFMLCYASTPGSSALRTACGSPFVHTLCGKIQDWHQKEHIVDILAKVNQSFKDKPAATEPQKIYAVPEIVMRFSKKCFLDPALAVQQ